MAEVAPAGFPARSKPDLLSKRSLSRGGAGVSMRERHAAANRLLKTMMVASIAIPLAVFSYASWVAYHNAFEHADEQLSAALDVISEHANKIFQSIDLTFSSVDAIIGDLSDEQIKASEEALHLQLSKLEKPVNAINAILVVDKTGHTLVSSALFPIPETVGVADRDFFLAQVKRDAGTFVGAVLQPRMRQGPFFGVSRRRPLRNGEFSGIIMVSVTPTVFTEFYRRIAGQTGGSFSLTRRDGTILARYSEVPGNADRFEPGSGFMQYATRRPAGGLVTSDNTIEGPQRRIGYRPLGYADLYVTDGMPTQKILSTWMQTIAAHLYFGVPATFFLFMLVLLTMRRTREVYAE